MSKKQTRTLLILIVLLAALGLLATVVRLSASKREKKASSISAKQESIVPQKVYTSFAWKQRGVDYTFSKKGNVWYWNADKTFPVNANYLTKLANTLNSLTPVQTIRKGDALSAYGLSQPAYTLTATAKDAEKTTFALGSEAVNSTGNYYLMVNGDPSKIYVVEGTLHEELSSGILSMMQLPALPFLQSGDLSALEIRGTANTVLTSKVKKSGKKTSVVWDSGTKDVTKNTAVKQIVSDVSSMTLASAQFYKPTAAQLSQCGFNKPAAVVTLRYTGSDGNAQILALTIGNAAPDGETRYVRLSGDSTVYAISASKLTELLSVADSGIPSN